MHRTYGAAKTTLPGAPLATASKGKHIHCDDAEGCHLLSRLTAVIEPLNAFHDPPRVTTKNPADHLAQ